MKVLFILFFLTSFSLHSYASPSGKLLYDDNCSICHNNKGLGGIGLPLNRNKIINFSRDYMFKTIRLGREGRIMPSFEELSDTQINAIIDYMESWSNVPRTLIFSDITIQGNRKAGKKIFKEKCASCHGPKGKSRGTGTGVTYSRERNFSIIPPDLNNQGFLASANDAFIKNSIINGRASSKMPSLKKLNLTDENLNDLVSYIRSLQKLEKNNKATEETEDPTLFFDSPYDFKTTVDNLKSSLSGMNFRHFPDRYLELGLTEEKNVNKKQLTLRFCNFSQLYKMLNADPRLGTILPCRITVVEQEDGNVQLIMMNISLLSRVFNNEQLSKGADEMQQVIIDIIDEATL
ncbi:MAG: c-type cytochrome [Gammaproteobacteria bacterium]|nr:c-type cytochrome [Gammaproteobacteria bacterium]